MMLFLVANGCKFDWLLRVTKAEEVIPRTSSQQKTIFLGKYYQHHPTHIDINCVPIIKIMVLTLWFYQWEMWVGGVTLLLPHTWISFHHAEWEFIWEFEIHVIENIAVVCRIRSQYKILFFSLWIRFHSDLILHRKWITPNTIAKAQMPELIIPLWFSSLS